jgi:hypothetical protein
VACTRLVIKLCLLRINVLKTRNFIGKINHYYFNLVLHNISSLDFGLTLFQLRLKRPNEGDNNVQCKENHGQSID